MAARKNGKTALVLAGGGLTGAVYEIGALRAMDDILLDRTVNDFDIYVGTSSGAVVCAFLANGVSPQEMLQVIDGTHPLASLNERKHIFNFDIDDALRWIARLPRDLRRTLEKFVRELDDMAVFDLLWSFSNLLPAGFFDGTGLGDFVSQTIEQVGLSNNFRDLKSELYLIATNLDSGRRTVFGPGYIETRISEAVAASSAVPMLYQPVRIDGSDYIDGSLRGNASIDLAIEHGASLIVVINPMVPFDLQCSDRSASDIRLRNISDGGFEAIVNQLVRVALHANLHYHVKQLQRTNENIDIILIEPACDDYHMFSHNIMRYSARIDVAQHGFEAVTMNLAKDFPRYESILATYGIPITRQLVDQELNEINTANCAPGTVRRILEERGQATGNRRGNRLVTRLELALSSLEATLDDFSREPA